MKVPNKKEVKHKNQLYRLLRALISSSLLANKIMFKGGTCAAMRGFLDRFSVDLDFDLPDSSNWINFINPRRAFWIRYFSIF